MKQPPKSPKELAKEHVKKNYTFSLNEVRVEQIRKLAAQEGLPVSALVDEAIKSYLEALKNGG